MNKINKKEANNKNEKIEKVSIQEKIAKKLIENNFDIDQIEGAEAYYSERYGWTLRKSN